MLFSELKKIFSVRKYLFLFLAISFLIFTLSVILPNFSLLKISLLSPTIGFLDKIKLLFSLYSSITTNFTLISATYTILISILFALNISLLVYYIKQRQGGIKNIKTGSVSGVAGLISGVLGIGCAACGTFILSSLLSLFGAASLVAWLPFGGEEFGFIGALLLLYSIYSLLKKITEPKICTVI